MKISVSPQGCREEKNSTDYIHKLTDAIFFRSKKNKLTSALSIGGNQQKHHLR